MQLDPLAEFLVVGAIFLAAGLVKGVLGMGLPTLAIGLLGLLMPVPQAASLLTLPSLVTNAWQALVGGALRSLLRRLWPFQLGIAIGIAAAAWLPAIPPSGGRLLLGVCLLAYGLSGLAGWRLPSSSRRTESLAGPAAGAATGVVTALTGVFVLPAVPYLQSLQLNRNELTQALGVSFTTSTLALGCLLAARGHLDADASFTSVLAIGPALVGMFLGQKLRLRMSEAVFRRCFFLGMVALGAWLALR